MLLVLLDQSYGLLLTKEAKLNRAKEAPNMGVFLVYTGIFQANTISRTAVRSLPIDLSQTPR